MVIAITNISEVMRIIQEHEESGSPSLNKNAFNNHECACHHALDEFGFKQTKPGQRLGLDKNTIIHLLF